MCVLRAEPHAYAAAYACHQGVGGLSQRRQQLRGVMTCAPHVTPPLGHPLTSSPFPPAINTHQDIGGYDIQKQEIREAVELPLTQGDLYRQLGIDPPRGVLLYGPPGTGKTMLAKAVAHHTTAAFIRVVGSEFVQKYLGEVSLGVQGGWEAVGAGGEGASERPVQRQRKGCMGGAASVGSHSSTAL